MLFRSPDGALVSIGVDLQSNVNPGVNTYLAWAEIDYTIGLP